MSKNTKQTSSRIGRLASETLQSTRTCSQLSNQQYAEWKSR